MSYLIHSGLNPQVGLKLPRKVTVLILTEEWKASYTELMLRMEGWVYLKPGHSLPLINQETLPMRQKETILALQPAGTLTMTCHWSSLQQPCELVLLLPFLRWENWGSERFYELPRVPQGLHCNLRFSHWFYNSTTYFSSILEKGSR